MIETIKEHKIGTVVVIVLTLIAIVLVVRESSGNEMTSEEYWSDVEVEYSPMMACVDDLSEAFDLLDAGFDINQRWGPFDERAGTIATLHSVYLGETYAVGQEQALQNAVDSVIALCNNGGMMVHY